MNYALYGIMYLTNPKRYVFKKEESELQEIVLSDRVSNEVVISDKKK